MSAKTGRLLVPLVVLAIVLVPPVTGVQAGGSTPEPTNATVTERIALNTTHHHATFEGRPDGNRWRRTPDDRAAFYGSDRNRLYYYDAETNTAHTVARPTGEDAFRAGMYPRQRLVGSSKTVGAYVLPNRERARYTDEGTIAVGTVFGPFVYDLDTARWVSEPENSLVDHPIHFATDPSGVVAAGDYYVMTVHSRLYMAPGNWTDHIAEPPRRLEWYRNNPTHEGSSARTIAYESYSKVGYPLVFRGSVGITDRAPTSRPGGWPVWEPPNEDVVRFATPNAGPTAVYDGAGGGTVIVAGADFVAYNVTTGEAEWRRDSAPGPSIRHNDTLYRHHRMIDLRTGEAQGLYATGRSFYETRRGGKRVVGDFEELHSISADGRYLVLTMQGQSPLGEYRVYGVRVVDTETRRTVAQRVVSGTYQSPWVGPTEAYEAAVAGDYAVVVSPAEMEAARRDGNGSATVIDLETNDSVAEIPYNPGRSESVHGTESGLLLVPQVPLHKTRTNGSGSVGRTTGHYTVYDPERNATVGRLPVTLGGDERVVDVRTRENELYLLATRNGTTRVTAYDGLDASLSVSATTVDDRIHVRVTDLNGRPVPDATVRLAGTERTTNASGRATFRPAPPAVAGTESYRLRVDALGQSHGTEVAVDYETPMATATEDDDGTARSDGVAPGFGPLVATLAVVGWAAVRLRR
jgi:hypothetical protein